MTANLRDSLPDAFWEAIQTALCDASRWASAPDHWRGARRAQVLAVADTTLFPRADSWYLGANIPGKRREMLILAGGLPAYIAKCNENAERGYEGFAIS
jgi:hypothetical protein